MEEIYIQLINFLALHPKTNLPLLLVEGFAISSIIQLENTGYINQNEKDIYSLTQKGKEIATHIDIFTATIEKQPKVCVMAVCRKKEANTSLYLIQKRLKEPFYGYYGHIAGKVKFGTILSEEILRELEEEAGITGDVKLSHIRHVLQKDEITDQVLADNIFHIFLVTNTTGKLVTKNQEGENIWMNKQHIQKLKNVFPDVLHLIKLAEAKTFSFSETIDYYP